MSYAIEITRPARKFLAQLTKQERLRVQTGIDALAETPRPHGCLKMKGFVNQWRIRVGRFRVVYSIYDAELLIEVVDIDDRKDIYRD